MLSRTETSDRIASVFHMKKRRVPDSTMDPFYRYFKWFIAYYRVVESENIEKYALGKLTWHSFKKLLASPNLLVIIPIDNNAIKPLRDYTRTLNYKATIVEKPVRFKGRMRKVPIPVLVFQDALSAYKHILYTTILATLEKPRENANLVTKAINSIESEKILEAFYTMIIERFNDIRGELITNPGKWNRKISRVTRVGLAFRILYYISME